MYVAAPAKAEEIMTGTDIRGILYDKMEGPEFMKVLGQLINTDGPLELPGLPSISAGQRGGVLEAFLVDEYTERKGQMIGSLIDMETFIGKIFDQLNSAAVS